MYKDFTLVLGGGGARGIANIGVLKELKKRGLTPNKIIGVSMGALVGASFCSGKEIKEIEKEALRLNTKFKVIKHLFDIAKPGEAFIKGDKIKKFISRTINQTTFKNLKIPLEILTTNLEKGNGEIIKNGKIIDAIMASISVPGIFPPVKINGSYYVDGGVTNPTPVDIAPTTIDQPTIAVDLTIQETVKLNKPGIITTMMRSYEIIRANSILNHLPNNNKNVILLKPRARKFIDSFKFYDVEKFIKAGEMIVKDNWREIEKLITKN